MKTPLPFVDDYLAYLLARASHLMSSEFHAIVESSGLSLMEWRVLASLSGVQSLSIGELADIVLSKQPTVTKLVTRMVQAGWIERLESDNDKRQSLVRLTSSGLHKVTPLLSLAKSHELQVTVDISAGQLKQLKKMLENMIARSTSQSTK